MLRIDVDVRREVRRPIVTFSTRGESAFGLIEPENIAASEPIRRDVFPALRRPMPSVGRFVKCAPRVESAVDPNFTATVCAARD